MTLNLKTYEKKYTKLENIVNKLDEEDLSLHEMMKNYKEGLKLVKECNAMLNITEAEVEQLIEEVQVTL